MLRNGKWLILMIIAVGLIAALLAVRVRQSQGRLALAYWGIDDGLIIRDARTIEWLVLDRSPDVGSPRGADAVDVRGATYRITARRDVTDSPGVSHIRAALLSDGTFTWRQPVDSPLEQPTCVALRFSMSSGQLTVAFDTTNHRLFTLDDRMPLDYSPAIPLIEKWLNEQASPGEEKPAGR